MKKIFFCFIILTKIMYAETATEIANRLGKQANTKYGSKSALQTNVTTPMQTSNQLTTLNGDGFNANLTGCVSTHNDIQLNFSSTSDIVFSVNIKQDNYTQTINKIVGVCSNGFITNIDSTWKTESLIYNKWIYDTSTNKVKTTTTTKSKLSQCQCTTSDCGQTSFGKGISDIIVSGIISSISNTNTNISLGSITYNNNTYNISMTNNSNCKPNNKYTGTDPKNYYNTQTIPPIDTATINAKDGSNPNSLYNLITPQNNVVVDGNNNIKTPNLNKCYTKYTIHQDDDSLTSIKKDTCSKFINNSSCTLKDKIICDYDGTNNCIYSIKNKTSTSAIISSHCVSVGSKQVCDDGTKIQVFEDGVAKYNLVTGANSFLYTKYIYDCGMTDNNIDRNNVNRTMESVTRNKTNQKFSYVNKDGETTHLATLSSNNCIIKWCSLKSTPKIAVEFSDSTNKSNTESGSSTNSIVYRQCSETNSNNFICPTKSGETIIEDCSCKVGNAGLNQVMGGLSAVKAIVGDFTCSK